MPEFKDLPDDFRCPYRDGCPYLEGLSTGWVFHRYQEVAGTECHYEYQLEELYQELRQERGHAKEVELENQQLKAQLHALHRRQFKGRKTTAVPASDCPSAQCKKRGAPVGHPPWQRAKPARIDQVVDTPTPGSCPDCHHTKLQPVEEVLQHVQEDIVLEPRTVVTCFRHQQAYCPQCDKNVWLPGPGEMPGAYIGPVAKATAAYLRYQLSVPDRKISQFFSDFFGLKFVPASACGFERQAVRRGLPLYEDLRQKIRALPVVHADETSWRHDGNPYWAWYAGSADLAFFHLDPHRSAEAAQTVLGEHFNGTLIADAFASYNGVHPKDRQSCLAHIKTKAKELEQEVALLKGKAADPAAAQFCQKIQEWVRAACQAHERLRRGRWRARSAKRKGQTLRNQLRALCAKALRYPKAEAFRKRLSGPEQKLLFTCFGRPGVPPTNNQAERSLRPLVIMRKVVQGTRSDKGLENHSVMRSLFETARRQGKKPQEFFLTLLTKTTARAQAALYRKPLPKRAERTPQAERKKPP
ncbi:MAG TPA: IS66 family transposase [Verrucomicrobiae bacterium]|nr:IS66 family transposase [Verrucomicrobiae bacterium]